MWHQTISVQVMVTASTDPGITLFHLIKVYIKAILTKDVQLYQQKVEIRVGSSVMTTNATSRKVKSSQSQALAYSIPDPCLQATHLKKYCSLDSSKSR